MRRITRKDLRGLYETAPQSLYDGIHEALAGLPEEREMRKVKKKIGTGLILAAVLLVLSVAGFAATRLNLFSDMTRYANPIVPLEGAEELVETGLGSAENEWATVTVEEAAYDGQSAMVLARIVLKEPEKYALFNAWYMDPNEDEYSTSWGPDEVESGTLEIDVLEGDIKIVNEGGVQAYYQAGKEIPIPEGREAAKAADCLIFRENGRLYFTNQDEMRVIRKDEKEILGFETILMTSKAGDTAVAQFKDGGAMAEAQPDGSLLIWCDGSAEESLPDQLDLKLRVELQAGGDTRSLDIPFTLVKSEAERTARYVPEGDGWIGDHVKVRQINVSFTKVQAYLTVDYDYDPRPEEEMGVWLHLCDAEGNAIATSRGSGGGPGDEDELGFYRQWEEMQSFDEIPDVIVLDAVVIGGDSLGQCVCRLEESE